MTSIIITTQTFLNKGKASYTLLREASSFTQYTSDIWRYW